VEALVKKPCPGRSRALPQEAGRSGEGRKIRDLSGFGEKREEYPASIHAMKGLQAFLSTYFPLPNDKNGSAIPATQQIQICRFYPTKKKDRGDVDILTISRT
jgi:hypothetical protein